MNAWGCVNVLMKISLFSPHPIPFSSVLLLAVRQSLGNQPTPVVWYKNNHIEVGRYCTVYFPKCHISLVCCSGSIASYWSLAGGRISSKHKCHFSWGYIKDYSVLGYMFKEKRSVCSHCYWFAKRLHWAGLCGQSLRCLELKMTSLCTFWHVVVLYLSQVSSFSYLFTFLLSSSVCNQDYPCEGMSRHATFENFGMAFLTLFQVSTGDNWNGIMKVQKCVLPCSAQVNTKPNRA